MTGSRSFDTKISAAKLGWPGFMDCWHRRPKTLFEKFELGRPIRRRFEVNEANVYSQR